MTLDTWLEYPSKEILPVLSHISYGQMNFDYIVCEADAISALKSLLLFICTPPLYFMFFCFQGLYMKHFAYIYGESEVSDGVRSPMGCPEPMADWWTIWECNRPALHATLP